jgi:hypothetical protein
MRTQERNDRSNEGMRMQGKDASVWGLPRGRTRIAACGMDVGREDCCLSTPHARTKEERGGEERVVEVGRRGGGWDVR